MPQIFSAASININFFTQLHESSLFRPDSTVDGLILKVGSGATIVDPDPWPWSLFVTMFEYPGTQNRNALFSQQLMEGTFPRSSANLTIV